MRKTVLLLLFVSAPLFAFLPQFTELVKKASPAVVNITATREPTSRQNGEEMPDILRRFFEEGRSMPSSGVGSGFIISADGYILTNNHVVDGADEINVALSDRRQRTATVVGTDKLSDLALLKIEAENLPVVEIGRSSRLEVGEWVVAIGSPFGFQLSVTAGIVSAKGRSLPDNGPANYVPFIQTDVAINPGNSGGPLFNLAGEVVGINSQIFTRSGGFMGLSFAIPIDVAMEVVEQLKEHGKVSRGWLGVGIQSLSKDLAESFGLDRPAGALVSRVIPDSPAEEAGIEVGDVIVEFNGIGIDLSSDLPHIVGRMRAESAAEVVVIRDKKRKRIDLAVGALPEDSLERLSGRDLDTPQVNRLGVEVADLSRQDLRRLGIQRGVLVTRVMNGPAADEGIGPDDVITHIDGEWVNSRKHFKAMGEELPSKGAISIRVGRDGQSRFIALKLRDE